MMNCWKQKNTTKSVNEKANVLNDLENQTKKLPKSTVFQKHVLNLGEK